MSQLELLISAKQIQEMVKKMGAEISREFAKTSSPGESISAIVVLKGAAYFASDLLRQLAVPSIADFIQVSSYGSGTQSSGTVKILQETSATVENRNVLLIDEIIDTGRTLSALKAHFLEHRPKSIRTACLLDKPSRREVKFEADYVGMKIEDKFVVGYGLDFGEKYRNYPEIFVYKAES